MNDDTLPNALRDLAVEIEADAEYGAILFMAQRVVLRAIVAARLSGLKRLAEAKELAEDVIDRKYTTATAKRIRKLAGMIERIERLANERFEREYGDEA